jgi:UDP-glucose 4-epimerase
MQSLVSGGDRELKVLLTGGLGFVGKHLIRRLGGAFDLTVFSDPAAARKSKSFVEMSVLKVIVGDIRDSVVVRRLFDTARPEIVVHLAAVTGLTRCDEDPYLAFSTNVLGSYNVVMGCVASNAKIIFASSKEVYGESTEDQTSEDAPLLPNNVYGLTKLLGERLIHWAAARYALDYTIVRLTNVYGPEGDQYNVQAMIASAASKGLIPIMGGHQLMNLIYVEDVAEAIATCLKNPKSSRETFNVGSKDEIAVSDLVTRLISALGMQVKIQRQSSRPGETMRFRPNLEKIEKSLGFTARTQLNDGLEKTIKWYREHNQVPSLNNRSRTDRRTEIQPNNDHAQ